MEPLKIDLEPWGYIPGNKLFYCGSCMKSAYVDGNWPHRGDSRSTRCIQHAMDDRIADLRQREGDLIKELGMNPIELEIIRHNQRMGKLVRSLTVGGLFTLAAAVSWIATHI
jgi:hypothetical protein